MNIFSFFFSSSFYPLRHANNDGRIKMREIITNESWKGGRKTFHNYMGMGNFSFMNFCGDFLKRNSIIRRIILLINKVKVILKQY